MWRLRGNHPLTGQRRHGWFQVARQRIPCSNAYAAAAVREPTPSLVRMLLTCRSTVFSLRNSSLAMAWLVAVSTLAFGDACYRDVLCAFITPGLVDVAEPGSADPRRMARPAPRGWWPRYRSSPGSRQSQETAGLKGANVPDGLFFQIQAWSAKKAGISNRFGKPTGMNS